MAIEGPDDRADFELFFAEAGLPSIKSIKVDQVWMRKHTPSVGGYYVVYADGYTSWSPAAAFEAGYTLVE